MKVIVFTGAGMSRESGLKTFRDSDDGLWEGHDINEVATIQGWRKNPQKVLDFYNMRRQDVLRADPNPGHLALAELEEDHDVTIITQNVDDLHERAGSRKVIHLHGEVLKVRSAEDESSEVLHWTKDVNLGDLHPVDGGQLRPHIVWFGEGLPELDRAIRIALADDVDVLIVVGTTLQVYPAAMIATESRARQAFLVDPHPPELPLTNLIVLAEGASSGTQKVVKSLMEMAKKGPKNHGTPSSRHNR